MMITGPLCGGEITQCLRDHLPDVIDKYPDDDPDEVSLGDIWGIVLEADIEDKDEFNNICG